MLYALSLLTVLATASPLRRRFQAQGRKQDKEEECMAPGFANEERSRCELYTEVAKIEDHMGGMQGCMEMTAQGMQEPNDIQLTWRGKNYMVTIDTSEDADDSFDQVFVFLDNKFGDMIDDGHKLHLEYMLAGEKYYIENGADLDAFLSLDPMYRWNVMLRGSIVNTVMPTMAPTETDAPTGAPTFAPTIWKCQNVFGISGDGHGLYTLYLNRITAWGGHGQALYKPSGNQELRAPTEPIYAEMATGHWNTIGVKMDGTITTWGHRSTLLNQNNAQKGLVSVRVGYNFACGMTADNTIKCWGTNHSNQALNEAHYRDIDDWVAYQNGGYFTCGVRETGEMKCWGRHNEGQLNIQENGAGAYRDVTCGHHFTVGTKQDDTPRCWGQNNGNQIGHCPKAKKFHYISCGGYHCCGIEKSEDEAGDERIFCWGYNGHGEVSKVPKEANNRRLKARAIIVNFHGSCLLKKEPGKDTDYQPVCWGLDNGNYFPNGAKKTEFYKARFPCETEE